MKTNYTYCINKDTCIHRRGCKRWVGNNTDEEVKELYTENKFVDEVDDEDCMNSHNVYDNVMPFFMLDRFRYSDGTDFKDVV